MVWLKDKLKYNFYGMISQYQRNFWHQKFWNILNFNYFVDTCITQNDSRLFAWHTNSISHLQWTSSHLLLSFIVPTQRRFTFRPEVGWFQLLQELEVKGLLSVDQTNWLVEVGFVRPIHRWLVSKVKVLNAALSSADLGSTTKPPISWHAVFASS